MNHTISKCIHKEIIGVCVCVCTAECTFICAVCVFEGGVVCGHASALTYSFPLSLLQCLQEVPHTL